VWERLPPLDLLKAFAFSMIAGTLLTVLATIFPAIRAAQLPPAAALRSEV
jgi:ABC-type lipoprotein release transport system permease subunit